jgi:hypothetical protein
MWDLKLRPGSLGLKIFRAILSACGPLNLIKPMPASPMGVAIAQMVSWSSLKSMMKAGR